METVKISELAKALGAPCTREGEIREICTDSREAGPGSLFVAIEGERFDGHTFIEKALEHGAECVLAHKDGPWPRDRVLRVPDTLRALLDIAAWYRTKFSPRVVGVTGSVGKTTTKDMIAAVLESGFRTIKTIGNQNNEVGAPKTILSIERDTQAAVIEMGMCGFGEIRDLALAARPQMGVITNIGVSHMELLGSRENILKAKLELAECLPDGATLFLCGDNDLLRNVRIPRLRVIFYGIENPECAVRGEILRSTPLRTDFVIRWEGREYPAVIPGCGNHLVQNALVAFAIGVSWGIPPERAVEALKNYQPSGMRQKVVEAGEVTVVEDCYNASPDSMAAAIRTLSAFPCRGKKILVASDMLELGEISRQSHYEVGRQAAQAGVDLVLAWGDEAREYVAGAQEAGMDGARFFGEKGALAQAVGEALRPGDLVWFKASRAMKLEEVIQKVYEGLGVASR